MGEIHEAADLDRWAEAGVDRLIVTPWRRSREAIEGMQALAALVELDATA